jgi:hypothetical protein
MKFFFISLGFSSAGIFKGLTSFVMKPKVIAVCLITQHRFFRVTALMLICFVSASQAQKQLRPDVYKNYIKTNTAVKVQTIERGKVSQTDSAALNNFQVPVNNKTVISYDKKIAAIDIASYRKFKAASAFPYAAQDVQIIPELHVEPGAGQTENIAYRIVFTLQQPLSYNETQKKFSARLGFFLLAESDNNNPAIKEPVTIEVIANEAESVAPSSVPISHLNLPSSNVELIADQVSDSMAVKVITASRPEGYTTYLKVKPALELSSNRTVLQGFGIQEIPVTVRFIGSNSSDSVKVNFSAEKGTVTPNSVNVSYNKPATVYLRSEGIGKSKLSAISSSVKSTELNFKFAFPWLFLLASILGGLTGSLAKYLHLKKKGSAIKPIIGGILIGFIGAVAYYGLGVNLLGVRLSAGLNEIAVLALSALCAYFGISLLKLDSKQ